MIKFCLFTPAVLGKYGMPEQGMWLGICYIELKSFPICKPGAVKGNVMEDRK
jgi:hypothetical protein